MIAYILKSAGCMLLLLAVYYLFLEREKMHRFNRYFLVFGLIFSLSVPFITFTITAEIPLSNQVSEINQRLAGQPSAPPAYTPPKNPAPTVNTPTDSSISYRVILWGFYLLVAAILLIRLLGNLYRLYSKINQNPRVSYQSATLILVEGCSVPHSFFSYIFVDKGLYESGRVDQSIFTHELTHAHQKHSIDTLFIEILKVVFWFNPVLYFYKKAIQMNHEFLADESVIAASNDVSAYQKLLLKINSGDAPHTLASSIHFSITKKRFIMMTKESTRLRTVSKQLALIPVLAGLIFAFSTRTITAQDVSSMSITELMEAVEAKMDSVDELSDNEKEDLNRLITKMQRELNVKVPPPPPPPLSVSLSPEEALQALTDSYSEQTSYYSSIKPMERNRDKLEASYEKVLILYKEVDKLEKKIDPKNPPPPPPKPLSPNERIETDSKKSPLAPQPSAGINDRNLLKILVNREGLILIDDEPTSIEKIKAKVKKFITNNGAEPELSDSPQKAAIVIETEQETPYKIYTEMLDKVQQAYLEIRNASAQAEYGVNYQKLVENSPAKTKIQQIYPVQISIADPDRKNN